MPTISKSPDTAQVEEIWSGGLVGLSHRSSGMISGVWTYLPLWLVLDGEVGELGPDSILDGTGIAANCQSMVASSSVPSMTAVHAAGADAPNGQDSSYLYDVTGRAGAVRDIYVDHGDRGQAERVGSEFLLTAGSLGFIARTGVSLKPSEGSVVTVRCWLEVIAGYEWEAFQLPDVRRTWSVAAVQIERRVSERREVVGINGRTFVEWTAGDVVELIEVPRMRPWLDDPPPDDASVIGSTTMTYVVDLYPR